MVRPRPRSKQPAKFVNTELAERRNLILANPLEGNRYPTVQNLVAAYQMVKAGEVARSHRHTPNALRLVIDAAPGATTIVEGRKIPMQPGDVLLTPNWCWHGHANDSRADAYWMDFLDVPLVQLLGPMFFEHHPDATEKPSGVDAASPMRFAWAETVRRLDAAEEIETGRREIELGSPALPTIALHVSRLEADAQVSTTPTTASAIIAVMQGSGISVIDGATFAWSRGDALAVPAGADHICRAGTESTLLRVSDEPLLRGLGWLRPIPFSPRA